MTEHIDKNFTLEDLSSKFEIPLTSMKIILKGFMEHQYILICDLTECKWLL